MKSHEYLPDIEAEIISETKSAPPTEIPTSEIKISPKKREAANVTPAHLPKVSGDQLLNRDSRHNVNNQGAAADVKADTAKRVTDKYGHQLNRKKGGGVDIKV